MKIARRLLARVGTGIAADRSRNIALALMLAVAEEIQAPRYAVDARPIVARTWTLPAEPGLLERGKARKAFARLGQVA